MTGNACLLNCGLILEKWEGFFFLNCFELHKIKNEEFPVRCSSAAKLVLLTSVGNVENIVKY